VITPERKEERKENIELKRKYRTLTSARLSTLSLITSSYGSSGSVGWMSGQ